jgi:serine protease
VVSHPPSTVRQVNLHSAFERALRGTKAGRIAGIVPPTGSRVHGQANAGRSITACMEPNCNLSYSGGPVQHTPHVYLVLWGPGWSSTPAAATYLVNFYTGLGGSPDDTWSTITSQYGDGSGSPSFGASVYVGTWNDTNAPPKSVTPSALAAEAAAMATTIGITDKTDAQVVIASQHGTCFSDGFAGSCGVVSVSSTGYCGWHSISSGGVPFTNLPYQLDAAGACGQDWINSGSAGTYDGFSTVGGHEYAETITDPDPTSGWFDVADSNISGGEIGDKCAWGGQPFGLTDPASDVTLSTGSFAMQSLWSNAGGGCVMSAGPTVTSPGTQTSTLGVAVNLAITASSGSSSALMYAAHGLPPGLKISSSTGHITGTPSTTAGTWHPAVTVSDGTQSAHVSFTWLVSSKAGPVKGYAAKCLDDYRGSTANGTKIDLWGCYGKVRQRVTFQANGELRLEGKCVTGKNGVTVLEPCTRAAAQTWTRRANGEYVLKAGGVCLAVPARSTANGTQLRLSACTNSAREHWSLP